jgi:hypothetical protein
LIIVAIVAAIWEWSAYNSSVKQATGNYGRVLDKFTTPLKPRRRVFLDGSACTRKYELSSFMVKDIYGGNHSFLVLHDLAGSELLDPQYDEYPADISKGDFRHYFEPIALTDATGGPADRL